MRDFAEICASFFFLFFFFNNNKHALFLNVLAGRLETFNSLFHVQIEVVN